MTRNFGARQAVNAGISVSDAHAISFIAADLQDPPEIIAALVEKWTQGNRFVIATRELRSDPFLTKVLAKLFYFFIRKFVFKNYPEGGFDIALLDRELINKIFPNSKYSDIKVLSYWLGYEPCVVKVVREKRKYGKSSWSFTRRIELLLDILIGFGSRFIRIFIGVGLFLSSFATLYILILLFSYALGYSNTPQGFNVLLSILVCFFGVIILILSLSAEYLIRILGENNRRPEFVIESKNY